MPVTLFLRFVLRRKISMAKITKTYQVPKMSVPLPSFLVVKRIFVAFLYSLWFLASVYVLQNGLNNKCDSFKKYYLIWSKLMPQEIISVQWPTTNWFLDDFNGEVSTSEIILCRIKLALLDESLSRSKRRKTTGLYMFTAMRHKPIDDYSKIRHRLNIW